MTLPQSIFKTLDIDHLRAYRERVDIWQASPIIGTIADVIHERQRGKANSRTCAQVHDNCWPGFGCEVAFKRVIPRASIVNEDVTNISDTTYANLQRDVLLDGVHVAIKGLDRTNYKTDVWISEKQRESIKSCSSFCKELVFMSYLPTQSKREYIFSATSIVTNLEDFATHFDTYAKKTANSHSYLLNVETAIDAGIYINLLS